MTNTSIPTPTQAETDLLDTDYALTEEQIAAYRQDGFVQLDGVLIGTALSTLRDAVVALVNDNETIPLQDERGGAYSQLFLQKVNLWQLDSAVRATVHSRRLGNLAARLSGQPVRLWHDQALFKPAHTGAKTPWHQDAVYWPHAERAHQITIWIALRDATIQNGCMSFIPRSHHIRSAEAINLTDPQDIFAMAPEMRGIKPVTRELKAGSVTFHHGMNFHFAGPNRSEATREAFAIIYMPDGTVFDGAKHIVTDALGLKAGDRLEGEMFPLVSDAA